MALFKPQCSGVVWYGNEMIFDEEEVDISISSFIKLDKRKKNGLNQEHCLFEVYLFGIVDQFT